MWGFTNSFSIHVERPENVCYKEYLGPDWKADYDGMRCGTVISNHGAFLDTMVHSDGQLPSFVAKEGVKKIPGIGLIAKVSQSIFLDRESLVDKDRAQKDIIKR